MYLLSAAILAFAGYTTYTMWPRGKPLKSFFNIGRFD
jgi:hypothetical protein